MSSRGDIYFCALLICANVWLAAGNIHIGLVAIAGAAIVRLFDRLRK